MREFHFVAGLPRSGSTLLCNILAQNPRFHTTHTSGCIEILVTIRNYWDKCIEHRANLDWDGLHRVLVASLNAYHSTSRPVVFDKSRAWLAYIEFIEGILERPVRIIVPMRPIPDVLASFEKLYRTSIKSRQIPGEVENYFRFQTIEGRCDYLLQPQNVVGLAHVRIKEAVRRGLSDRLHFVEFNELTLNPKRVMKGIYDFLGETVFPHDFDNIEQFTHEDDSVHGYENMHRIRSRIQPMANRTLDILGEELVRKYSSAAIAQANTSAESKSLSDHR